MKSLNFKTKTLFKFIQIAYEEISDIEIKIFHQFVILQLKNIFKECREGKSASVKWLIAIEKKK